MFKKFLPLILISLLVISCSKDPKPGYQATTTMRDLSQEMNFQPEVTEIIDTTREEEIPRYVLTNQPITETPVGVPSPNQPATPSTNTTLSNPPQTPPQTPIPTQLQPGDYTAQLLSASERAPVEAIRQKLSNANYETEIQVATVNGQTMYRLRLSGSFSQASAEQLAKEIQSKFSSDIRGYWVTTK